MNDDIQFGHVEEAAPKRALRPDENHHYAVAAYGEPQEGELPIYIDLDAIAEIEVHARSDMSVELGGVLLGGSFLDRDGRPFVVISDMLPAAHYESTKGSFKFTHDTWSQISRQRQQLAPELAMVGWYHTHPGWGVFLSGMDLFICENFFSKKLDVALVVDPCRSDRGMFVWSDEETRQAVRTSGFFVTASRFRAAQLEHFVAELGSTMATSTTPRYRAAQPAEMPTSWREPAGQTPTWMPQAMLGGLLVQCLLLLVIALRLLAPPNPAVPASDPQIAASLEKLNTAVNSIEARRSADLAAERVRAKAEFLDTAFRELKSTEEGAIQRLTQQFDQAAKLSADVGARDAEIRELKASIADARSKLQSTAALAQREENRLQKQIDELSGENASLKADLEKNREALAAVEKSSEKPAALTSLAGIDARWWWLSGAGVIALSIAAGTWWFGRAEAKGQPSQESIVT